MTLIVSWIGVDSRKISSLNFASDSRISWNNKATFDNARKVFGCKSHPVIIGYCGDVLFPSMVVSQLIDLADNGLLFSKGSNNEEMFSVFYEMLIEQFNKYPWGMKGVIANSIQILFGSRKNEIDFLCRTLTWNQSNNTWTISDIPFNTYSDKLFVLGSGKTEFENRFSDFKKVMNQKQAVGFFNAFVRFWKICKMIIVVARHN